MNILDKIVAHKKLEVEQQALKFPIEKLKESSYFQRSKSSMKDILQSGQTAGIIAEFKRKSPSKGWIHQDANVVEIAKGYQNGGVSMMSCLTDESFFGGSTKDFESARKNFRGPILRKDFIISAYQVYESKAMGADVILLIAAILTKDQVVELTDLAHRLGMEVLMEFHNRKEIEVYYDEVDAVGINNRDLTDFSVSLLSSIDLKKYFDADVLMISESGLDHPGIVSDLHQYGFRGFLMGEYFMKSDDPGTAAAEFVKDVLNRRARKRA